MGNQRGWYGLHFLPMCTGPGELRPELIKISESLLAADQIGIGDGIGGASEEIG